MYACVRARTCVYVLTGIVLSTSMLLMPACHFDADHHTYSFALTFCAHYSFCLPVFTSSQFLSLMTSIVPDCLLVRVSRLFPLSSQ